MIESQVIAFMCVAAMLTLTPGADTMLVVRNVLRGGWQDGIITTCGICTGLFVHATLSALDVSVILLHSATAFHLVQYAGACYLVWLGIPSLRDHALCHSGRYRTAALLPGRCAQQCVESEGGRVLPVAAETGRHPHNPAVFRQAFRVWRPGGACFVCELHPFRQITGGQAQFTDPKTGARGSVSACVHDVLDYLFA